MIVHGVAGLVVVGLLGVLPALAIAGPSVATPFLAPLALAVVAGTAATLEFGVGGSIGEWFTVIAVLVNLASVLVLLLRVGRRRRVGAPGHGLLFQGLGVVAVAAGVAWPLLVLAAPVIGYDAGSIWLVHTALVWAGHHTMVSGLTSKAYAFTNADYPPLVPGVGALTYAVVGHVDERLAVASTVVLGACAVAALATGVLAVVPAESGRARRALTLGVVVAFCGGVFGISGPGALSGYADTLWSAAAVAATVYGLVLPPTRRHLRIAGLCLAVGALTKNEGFIVSGAVSVLVALRYIPWAIRREARSPARRLTGAVRGVGPANWARALTRAVVPMVPGALWVFFVRQKGIGSQLFAPGRDESIPTRFAATASAMARQLDLAPAAALVLVVGVLVLRRRRDRAGLANPAWLWIVAALGLTVIGATYVFGTIEIHFWLATSVSRTTIFDQVAFLCDMTVWALLAIGHPATVRHTRTPSAGVVEQQRQDPAADRRRPARVT